MAKDYFQSDEFNELLDFYERRKKKRKSIYLDAEEFADLADYYLGNDCPLSAMEAVDTGLAIHYDSEVLLIMKSAIYIYQFQFQKAEAILNELDESNPDVLYQQAQLQYAYHHNTPKAEEMWREWLRIESEGEADDSEYRRESYIHIISTLAVLREPKGDTLEKTHITEVLRRWVREYIDTFQPLGKYDYDIQLADICRENELPDLLCEALSQVLEEQPYLNKGWSTLALAYYTQMEYEQALEACSFALAINPNDMDAILTKAYTLYNMYEWKEAKPIFKEYLDNGGDAVQILPYAEMLFSDGDHEEALAQLNILTEYLEKKKEEHIKQMEAAAQQNNIDDCKKARKAYADFIDLYKKTQSDIGDICYRKEHYKESINAYVRLLDTGVKTAEAYYMIGLNHLEMCNLNEAMRYFGLALTYTDDKILTGIDIAMSLTINNHEYFALKMLELIDDLSNECGDNPSAKNIATAKSLTYLKVGDTEQFLSFFKTACEDTPDLIQKVYGSYFPADLPVSEWHAYAQREIQTLLNKISKEDVHIAEF